MMGLVEQRRSQIWDFFSCLLIVWEFLVLVFSIFARGDLFYV